MDSRATSRNGSRPGRAGALALALTVGLGACDFDVTNPGPVEDEFLNDPGAIPAVVNGMGRGLADALNWIAYTGAAVTREVHPSGSTGSFGISPLQQRGVMQWDDLQIEFPWNEAQRARYSARSGIERMQEHMEGFGSSPLAAQALIWEGYTNRLLGENMCEAVIDGGGIEPRERFLQIAEDAFTQAIQIGGAAGASNLVLAGHAGRASVRVHLGDWAGALADAAAVPDAFVYQAEYFSIGDLVQANRIFHASEAAPYKAHTQWNTVKESYFQDTGDPRTPWRLTDEVGDAAVQPIGNVPWFPQEKFDSRSANINLSSGREMRLIEAEALLRDGAWEDAMAIVNAIRTSVTSTTTGDPLEPWDASNIDEAWTALLRERGIELWLEARRMGDFRRWLLEDGLSPDLFHPLEIEGADGGKDVELALHPLSDRVYCYPIPPSERETNPNLSTTP